MLPVAHALPPLPALNIGGMVTISGISSGADSTYTLLSKDVEVVVSIGLCRCYGLI